LVLTSEKSFGKGLESGIDCCRELLLFHGLLILANIDETMSEVKDIRWQYKYVKFNKVLKQLTRFLEISELTEIEEQGVIKAFEYTFEFAWKTLQYLLKSEGIQNIANYKEVIESSLASGYISDKTAWEKMMDARNLTYFTYDEQNAEEMVEDIRTVYLTLFMELRNRLKVLKNNRE
jgi:nucleotidyltransferase substrate binding protein (TIGR01987 family)